MTTMAAVLPPPPRFAPLFAVDRARSEKLPSSSSCSGADDSSAWSLRRQSAALRSVAEWGGGSAILISTSRLPLRTLTTLTRAGEIARLVAMARVSDAAQVARRGDDSSPASERSPFSVS